MRLEDNVVRLEDWRSATGRAGGLEPRGPQTWPVICAALALLLPAVLMLAWALLQVGALGGAGAS